MMTPDPPSFSDAVHDPLIPWLSSISNALSSPDQHDLHKLLSECLSLFKSHKHHRDDIRFLRIWFPYMDCSDDYHKVFKEMEESNICLRHSLFYETYALFLEAKGNAESIGRLRKATRLFCSRMREILNARTQVDETSKLEKVCNPWNTYVVNSLL